MKLLVNQGSCCQGINSAYHIRVGRAKQVTGPYLDRHGVDLRRGGGTLLVAAAGTQVGPGHFGWLVDDGVEKFSCHYEGDTTKKGRSFLEIRPLLWSLDGWPTAGDNVKDGTYQLRSQRTGTVLETPPNAANGFSVETARYLIRDHQQWRITPAGGGCYRITDRNGKAALEATDRGMIVTNPVTGTDPQLWQIDQLTDGS